METKAINFDTASKTNKNRHVTKEQKHIPTTEGELLVSGYIRENKGKLYIPSEIASMIYKRTEPEWVMAEKYMGKNFYSPYKILDLYTDISYAKLERIPSEIMEAIKSKDVQENFILIPIPEKIGSQELTLGNYIRYCNKKGNIEVKYEGTLFYNSENDIEDMMGKEVCNRPANSGWHLIRIDPVKDTLGKGLEEQLKVLNSEESEVGMLELTFMIITKFLDTEERLLSGKCVRTSDVPRGGVRACVGSFRDYGLYFFVLVDGGVNGHIGLGSRWKY